jgi:dTDP-4-dehydrorhamnose reductase
VVAAPDGPGRVPLRRRGAGLTRSKLLVTGADGQLGRAIAELRTDAVLLSRADLDVTDAGAVAEVVSRHAPGVVVHAAAWTAVDEAEAAPDEAWAVNVGGTEAVARASAKVEALLVYPSTDYVFSGEASRPYRENDAAKPRSVYGRTKLEGEAAARTCPRHLIVRTSWVFGDGDNFVRAVIARGRERTTMDVVGDQIGRPTYAPDLGAGLLRLVDGGHVKAFHLAGGGGPCSRADLAEAALDASHRAGLIEGKTHVRRVTTDDWASGRAGPAAVRPRYSVLDCSRAESVGIALRPWREAVEEYVSKLAAQAREERS